MSIGDAQRIQALEQALAQRSAELEQRTSELAAVALENTRLVNQTQEALSRETASAEILRVISGSPTDVQPVFNAIVSTAVPLIACDKAYVILCDATELWAVAGAGMAGLVTGLPGRKWPVDPQRNFPSRVITTRTMLHLPDLTAIDLPEDERTIHASGGVNATLMLPLLRHGNCIGVLAILREHAGAFSDKEISLAESFRDQAMIAIENVRLFNETKEALEQQKASAEVLNVISNSVSDSAPVFQAIVQSCQRLFASGNAIISLVGEDGMVRHEAIAVSDARHRGMTAEDARRFLDRGYPRPLAQSYQSYPIRKRQVVHYPDMVNGPRVPEAMRQMGRDVGNFSMLIAPMLWEGKGIGTIHVARFPPVAFTEKEFDLLRTFADQAVIAIQNARLFNETKEALERQIATADVLRVLGSSMTDTQPVFDSIVTNCGNLLHGSRVVLWLLEPDGLRARASNGGLPGKPVPVDQSSPIGACVAEMRVIHLPDLVGAVERHPLLAQLGVGSGFRSGIYTPLLRDGRAIGGLAVLQKEASAFNDKDIALLDSFAGQAVIAIENARLFRETQEALERQTATADVLQVISSSVADAAPVFDKILESGIKLFGTPFVNMGLIGEDGMVHLKTLEPASHSDAEVLRIHPLLESLFPQPARGSIHGYVAYKRQVAYYPDVQHGADVPEKLREITRPMGNHSMLTVPMVWEGTGIGAMQVARFPPSPFSDKEISLLKTFADQAVIAIQNARLFNETREALEQQTASAEILSVISKSVADTAPVFDTILQSCQKLFDSSEQGMLLVSPEGKVTLAAHRGAAEARLREIIAAGYADSKVQVDGIRNRIAMQFRDTLTDEAARGPLQRVAQRLGIGSYSQIIAPMAWEDHPVGWLYAIRQPATGFNDKEVATLQTFADQAVIAIQNAHMFRETQEALERQTATTEVLQVINASPGDLEPVFSAIAQRAARLCAADAGGLWLVQDGMARFTGGQYNVQPAFLEYCKAPIPATYLLGRDMHEGALLHVGDIKATEPYQERLPFFMACVDLGLFRTFLGLGLTDENGALVGVFTLVRNQVQPFTEAQIALVQSFAAQAQIAMKNARLMRQTQDALEQQTASAEVLAVIGNSMADPKPVFDKILESCQRLFASAQMGISLMGDDGLMHLGAHRGSAR